MEMLPFAVPLDSATLSMATRFSNCTLAASLRDFSSFACPDREGDLDMTLNEAFLGPQIADR